MKKESLIKNFNKKLGKERMIYLGIFLVLFLLGAIAAIINEDSILPGIFWGMMLVEAIVGAIIIGVRNSKKCKNAELKDGVTYYESGNIRYKGMLKNGLANGKGVVYYENGNKASEGIFKDDKLEGKGITYYESGSVRYEGMLKNGKAEGKGIVYYENGNPLSEGTYRNNKLQGLGKLYHNNGYLLYEGELKNGKPHGMGVTYDQTGYELYKGKYFHGHVANLKTRIWSFFYHCFYKDE